MRLGIGVADGNQTAEDYDEDYENQTQIQNVLHRSDETPRKYSIILLSIPTTNTRASTIFHQKSFFLPHIFLIYSSCNKFQS